MQQDYLVKKDELTFICSPKINELGWVTHAFTTRVGGFSKGVYKHLNLNYELGEDRQIVRKNYQLVINALKIDESRLVENHQVHEDKIKIINGLTNFLVEKYDGFVTDIPGVCLTVKHADCTPVFFVDKVKRCIGTCHSGWRGTVRNIVGKTVKTLAATYGSKPENISVLIGPAICAKCFEVGQEVIEEFRNSGYGYKSTFVKKDNGKYLLDLKEVIYNQLLDTGIAKSNIEDVNMCTMCDKEHFYSHRRDGLKRGSHVSFIYLNE